MDPIIPIETIKREAAEAAARYTDVNAACPYPFGSEAGKVFREHFQSARAAQGASPDIEP